MGKRTYTPHETLAPSPSSARRRVAGFVLTGGQSTRMGRDKALLPVGGETLCERIADVLSCVCDEVLLVGRPERFQDLRYDAVADLHPGLGPLSGLETCLHLQIAEWNVVSSCDVYNLKEGWLRSLMKAARDRPALCTVAQDASGRCQPLCGVYRGECYSIVAKAIQEGRLRAMDLLRELNAQTVAVEGSLLNLNTPDQYQELLDATRRQ